jgi:hypothetical protein
LARYEASETTFVKSAIYAGVPLRRRLKPPAPAESEGEPWAHRQVGVEPHPFDASDAEEREAAGVFQPSELALTAPESEQSRGASVAQTLNAPPTRRVADCGNYDGLAR